LAEPLTPIRIQVEGSGIPPVFRVRGSVSQVEASGGASDLRFVLNDESGANWSIRVTSPVQIVPLSGLSGAQAVVEIVAGFPTVYGLSIVDSMGVVLAGASDQAIGEHVLKEGAPGFRLSLLPGDCRRRPGPDCTLSVRNLRLAVEHQGQNALLANGDSVVLDGCRVHCMIAEEIEYDPRCADAGLHAVSWVILREPMESTPGR
jgi:hypothetical protein